MVYEFLLKETEFALKSAQYLWHKTDQINDVKSEV